MILSPSSPEIKIKELTFLEIQDVGLSHYTSKNNLPLCYKPYTQSTQNYFLNKLQANDVISFVSQNNRILESFSYLLFKMIYGGSLDQNFLKRVKIDLYADSINLNLIQGHPLGNLKSEQMKKFIVQFFFQLCFSDFNVQLDKKLHKHPVVLIIMSMFLRCLLANLGLQQAKSYQHNLPFETVIELLGDYLDLNFRKNGNSYMFIESSMFIFDKNSQILVGRYGSQSSRSFPRSSKSNSTRMQTQQSRTSWHLDRKDNLFSNDSQVQLQAPTPCFNTMENSAETGPRYGQIFGSFPVKNNVSTEPSLHGANFRLIFEPEHLQKLNKMTTPSISSLEEKLQQIEILCHSEECADQAKHFKTVSKGKQLDFIGQGTSSHELSIDRDFATEWEECECRASTRLKLALNSNLYSLTIKDKPTQAKRKSSFFLPAKKFKIGHKHNESHLETESKKSSFHNILCHNIQSSGLRTQQSDDGSSPCPSIYSQPEIKSFAPYNFQGPFNPKLTSTDDAKSNKPFSMFPTSIGEPMKFQPKMAQVKFFYKRQ